MFWDVTPPATWIKYEGMEPISADTMHHYQNSKDELQVYYRAIASVMESCLYLYNPACVESGLHGLGHLVVLQLFFMIKNTYISLFLPYLPII